MNRAGMAAPRRHEDQIGDTFTEVVDAPKPATKLTAAARRWGAAFACAEAIEGNPDIGVLCDVLAEVERAVANWPPFNSAHEGFAVICEEMDELKAHVWTNQKRRDLPAMRAEAIQVAAMAVRFVLNVCSEERGRR